MTSAKVKVHLVTSCNVAFLHLISVFTSLKHPFSRSRLYFSNFSDFQIFDYTCFICERVNLDTRSAFLNIFGLFRLKYSFFALLRTRYMGLGLDVLNFSA